MECYTDAGNVDNELFLAMWFDKEGVGEKVCTHASYFRVSRPSLVSVEGLFEVLETTVQSMGITAVGRNWDRWSCC